MLRGFRGWNTRRAIEEMKKIFPEVCIPAGTGLEGEA